MIGISKLSSKYFCRTLETSDMDQIIDICRQNKLFYEYTEARLNRENILDDMNATPPGITMADKYYFGFFDDRELVAIMDLTDAEKKATYQEMFCTYAYMLAIARGRNPAGDFFVSFL